MQTASPEQTAPPTARTTTAVPDAPPPGGRAAVEGRYLMKIRSTDYERQNIVSGMPDGEESTWPISTVCTGESCRLKVHRELESGGFDSFTLDEIKDRTYAASSTGTDDNCIIGSSGKGTRKRLAYG